ncbi:MAG: hypothetical protein K6347_03940 [Campylobacterales bacterium]
MRAVASLAFFLARSLLRQRATLIFLLLSLAMIGLSLSLGELNIAVPFRLFENVMLASQAYLLVIASVVYLFETLSKERLGGFFVLPLSTPLSRDGYLLALIGGIAIAIGLLLGLYLVADGLLLWLIEGEKANYWILVQLFNHALAALLVTIVGLTTSQWVSSMNAIIYTLLFYMIGQGADELWLFSQQEKDEMLHIVAWVVYYLLPNFSRFDHLSLILSQDGCNLRELLVYPILYAMAWGWALYLVASWKFRKRSLLVGRL